MAIPGRTPPQPMRFESGDTFAKIYVGTATRPPVWVGRSQGIDNVARVKGCSLRSPLFDSLAAELGRSRMHTAFSREGKQ